MVDKVRKNKRTLTVLPAVASFCAVLALIAPSCGDSAKRLTSDDSLYLAEIARAERDGTPVPQHPTAAQPQDVQPVLDTVWPDFPYTGIGDAPYDEIFNDSNRYQYAFAERVGISPIHTIGQAYFTRRPVVKVVSGPHYVVDSLSHSVPFLVPQAAKLLDDIGAAFIENLKKKGITGWRIRVSSLLRTKQSVKQLRRVNRNATDSSTHQFATTFDIPYNKFIEDDNATPTDEVQLKRALGEVLLEMRRRKRCMVKHEKKSPCFHITSTSR